MNTSVNTSHKSLTNRSAKEIESVKEKKELSAFWKDMEFNRFGYVPMLLLILGIFGGIAAATGIMDSWIRLAAVAFSSTICLAMVLAVAPMRLIFSSLAIALIIDLLIIIF